MSIEQAISSIASLSVAEQMQVMSVIWENLPEDVAGLMPPSEEKILDERLAKYRDNPSNVVTEQELKDELRQRRNK